MAYDRYKQTYKHRSRGRFLRLAQAHPNQFIMYSETSINCMVANGPIIAGCNTKVAGILSNNYLFHSSVVIVVIFL